MEAWLGAVEAIQATGVGHAVGANASVASQPTAAPGFAQWIGREVETLNTQLVQAELGVQRMATGQVENLHDVMLQLEQARLALQVAAQVRSRVLEAYQEVMRMQV